MVWREQASETFGRFKHISFGLLLPQVEHCSLGPCRQREGLAGGAGGDRLLCFSQEHEWNGNYDHSLFFENVGGGGDLRSRTFSALSPFQYPTEKRGFRLLNYRQCSSSMCSTTKIVTVAVILH